MTPFRLFRAAAAGVRPFQRGRRCGARTGASRAADGKIDRDGVRRGARRRGTAADSYVLHFHGAAQILGIAGTADDWEDVRSGANALYIDAGPLSGGQGWDGTNVWNRDASGVVWNDGSTLARMTAIDQAYQTTFRLWSPGYGGAAVTVRPEQSAAGHRYDVLRVSPPGGAPFELWIDVASHLPGRMVLTVGTTTATTVFGDYRRAHGLMQPFAVGNIDSSGDQVSFVAAAADADEPAAPDALRRPAMHVDDVELPGGTTSIPFELVDNHVDLPVTINGKGPYHFLFDTGGQNIIDTEAAKALGHRRVGKRQRQRRRFDDGDDPVRYHRPLGRRRRYAAQAVFVIVPVRAGFGVASGQPVDGLIGFEVLARFVTTFDYAEQSHRAADAPPPLRRRRGRRFRSPSTASIPTSPAQSTASAAAAYVDTGSRIALQRASSVPSGPSVDCAAERNRLGANGFGVGGACNRAGSDARRCSFAGFTLPRSGRPI